MEGATARGRDVEVLARLAADGDRLALEQLLAQIFTRVHGTCTRLLWRAEHRDLVDDTRQEVLIRVARGVHRFDGRSKFTTWLHPVTVRCCLDAMDRAGRHPTDPLDQQGAAEPESTSDPASDAAVAADVDTCLSRLAPHLREALLLADLAELSYPEVAARCDIAVGTVKSRVSRAREAMRRCLTADG